MQTRGFFKTWPVQCTERPQGTTSYLHVGSPEQLQLALFALSPLFGMSPSSTPGWRLRTIRTSKEVISCSRMSFHPQMTTDPALSSLKICRMTSTLLGRCCHLVISQTSLLFYFIPGSMSDTVDPEKPKTPSEGWTSLPSLPSSQKVLHNHFWK